MSRDLKQLYKRVGDELFSAGEIQKRVQALAKEIEDYYLPGGVAIMPTLPGSLIFAADLMLKLRIPVQVFPALVIPSLDPKDPQPTILTKSILPEKLLVVDIMVDTGKTLHRIGEHAHNAGVHSVELCTLIHRGKVPQDDLPVRFVGFHYRGKESLVGYGFHQQGYLSNLPEIYKYNSR